MYSRLTKLSKLEVKAKVACMLAYVIGCLYMCSSTLLAQTGTTALSVVALQDHWINLEVGAAVNRCGLLSEDKREHSFL